MTNLKFSFSESRLGSVHIPPKPIFLFKFSNFREYPENAPNHILFSNSAGKILKMAMKSEPHGLCSWNFWNFLYSMGLSNGENFKDFKMFDLTWVWWIWLEWPNFKLKLKDHFLKILRNMEQDIFAYWRCIRILNCNIFNYFKLIFLLFIML